MLPVAGTVIYIIYIIVLVTTGQYSLSETTGQYHIPVIIQTHISMLTFFSPFLMIKVAAFLLIILFILGLLLDLYVQPSG